jgi:hypothetical protein
MCVQPYKRGNLHLLKQYFFSDDIYIF